MNANLRIAILLILSVIAGIILADEAAKAAPATRPSITHVISAQSQVGKTFNSKQGAYGTVTDFVIDLQQGRVALIVFDDLRTSVAKSIRGVLPPSALYLDQNTWRIKPDVTEKQLAAAREFTVHVEKSGFQRDRIRDLRQVFNSKAGEQNKAASTQRPLGKLVLWSALRATKIMDEGDAVVGHVRDLGMSPETGEILYVAMNQDGEHQTSKNHFPIPLSAVVVDEQDKAWVIELPKQEIEERESVSSDTWPLKVSEAWIEYVHVRYGNSERSGVQTERKAKPATEQ